MSYPLTYETLENEGLGLAAKLALDMGGILYGEYLYGEHFEHYYDVIKIVFPKENFLMISTKYVKLLNEAGIETKRECICDTSAHIALNNNGRIFMTPKICPRFLHYAMGLTKNGFTMLATIFYKSKEITVDDVMAYITCNETMYIYSHDKCKFYITFDPFAAFSIEMQKYFSDMSEKYLHYKVIKNQKVTAIDY